MLCQKLFLYYSVYFNQSLQDCIPSGLKHLFIKIIVFHAELWLLRASFSFATMFPTLFNNYMFIYRDILND